MAFIDPKEELLNIILTQHGRKKLAEGDLKIKYYAFFDDEVDYLVSSGFTTISSSVQIPIPGPEPVYALSGFSDTGGGAYLATALGSGSQNQLDSTIVVMYQLINTGSGAGLGALVSAGTGSGAASSTGYTFEVGSLANVGHKFASNSKGVTQRRAILRAISGSDAGKIFFHTMTVPAQVSRVTGSIQDSSSYATSNGNFTAGGVNYATIGVNLAESTLSQSAGLCAFIGLAQTSRALTEAEVLTWYNRCTSSLQVEMCPVAGVSTTFLYQARDFTNGVLLPRSGGNDHCYIATGSLTLIDVSGSSLGSTNNS